MSSSLPLADYLRDITDFPKPGILFKDITPLLKSPAAMQQVIDELAQPWLDRSIDVVAAVEARGFLFAVPLALKLGAAFVPIRKPGKLPYHTLRVEYDLEYGNDAIEIHSDAISPGMRVLLLDDLLATGGTVQAACRLIEQCGGQVAGCSFVIELSDLGGKQRLCPFEVHSLIQV